MRGVEIGNAACRTERHTRKGIFHFVNRDRDRSAVGSGREPCFMRATPRFQRQHQLQPPRPDATPSPARTAHPGYWPVERPSHAARTTAMQPDWPAAADWEAVAPLIAPARRRGRRTTTDLHAVVSAICHHWRTGCPWRKLPPDCPPWPTVYGYFRRWTKDGTLRKLRTILIPPSASQSGASVPRERLAPRWISVRRPIAVKNPEIGGSIRRFDAPTASSYHTNRSLPGSK